MHRLSFFAAILAAFAYSTSAAVLSPRATSTCKDSEGISPTRAKQVEASFSAYSLAPGVIASSIEPTVDLEAVYSDGKAVDLGNVFSIAETTMEPNITFTAEKKYNASTTNYTLLLVDPDAPSPSNPTARFFLHLLRFNLHPSCISLSQQNSTTLDPYASFTPLSLALHRYVFLVYRQPAGVFVPPVQLAEITRNNFDLGGFVEKAGLVLVGGNFLREGLASTGAVGAA